MTQLLVLVDLIHSRFSALNSQLSDLSIDYDDMSLDDIISRLDFVFQLYKQLHVSLLSCSLLTIIAKICVCHACAQEANRSALLAHQILRSDNPIQLWELVGLFSRLTLNLKVRFSVGGIFTLDRSLISTVGVIALSYLIIAIQLRGVDIYIGVLDSLT
ncbi:hypothetical protein J6590_085702 [Homalodisca vitripennis]|nr:hypothetical protein J6590_085702 [Homalodisca vitripennis]